MALEMKIHAITHTAKTSSKEHKSCFQNQLHYKKTHKDPLMNQKEYVMALNSTKIERLLAKPFIRHTDYFDDGITKLKVCGSLFAACTHSNEIRVNNGNETIFSGFARGLGDVAIRSDGIFVSNNSMLYFCKFNELSRLDTRACNRKTSYETHEKKIIFDDNTNHKCCAKSWKFAQDIKHIHAALDDTVCLMDDSINIISFEGRISSTIQLRDSFGKIAQKDNILFCYGQRNLQLIDQSSQNIISSEQYGFKTNDIVFKDETYFITANEDSFLYLHDMRRLKNTVTKYVGHVNSVKSVDFANDEIVSGSIDQTVRIFNCYERQSRDVYYSKRMLAVNVVSFFKDNYILSGSEDGNIRLWRVNASTKENLTSKEENALLFNKMLKEKYYHIGDIRRIDRHRFLPNSLKGRIKNETEHYRAIKRREERYKHSETHHSRNHSPTQ